MAITNFTINLDSDLIKQSEVMYHEHWIDLSTAINVFLRKSIEVVNFPFDVRTKEPNKETLLALLEAEKIS